MPKAFVVLAADAEPGPSVEAEFRRFVRDRLAKYEYPREVEFVDDLPRTTSGKLRRVALEDREPGGRDGDAAD